MKRGNRKGVRSSLTHYAVAQYGKDDSANFANTENSLGACCKNFWTMNESGVFTTCSDVVDGSDIVHADLNGIGASITAMNDGDANSVNMCYWGGSSGVASQVGLTNKCEAPMDKDFMLVMCVKYKEDPSPAGEINKLGMASIYYGGNFGTDILVGDGNLNAGTWSNWGIPLLVLHPGFAQYHCRPDAILGVAEEATIETMPYAHPEYTWDGRIADTDHIFAAVRRGDYLEHWADGVMTGRAAWHDNTQTYNTVGGGIGHISESNWYNTDFGLGHKDRPNDLTESKTFRCSHGGYGQHDDVGEWTALGGNSGAVAEQAQDYYGNAFFTWQDGAPNDIGTALIYMKEQWTQGNKIMYPNWVTLR